MSPSPTDRHQRIDALFDALLDLPPDEQMPFLDQAAANDPELHGEVLLLLRAHRRAEGFLDAPAPTVVKAFFPDAPDRIGPWRIVQPIGEGGMGAVYLGERADGGFEQRVAIKLIRGGTPGLIRRFLEERRILALLEHPGIARLIDGGVTTAGLPYFAMELIDGEPLTGYCDRHGLTVHQRLELVDQVCDAVSYAHHHLIIHRDLKPPNILVTPAGRVKLLDFGIAKVLSGGTAGPETDTRLPVMTPEFAAPEQVRGEAVSTATDVYALGVLLYLLLTGTYPYDLRRKSLPELIRTVCEEEPPRPSSRAPELARQLQGDLDLVVMTALQKDPARRYQSPARLAEDLGRVREGRPILARADSAGYRLRKFVGRHQVAVGIAAALVALLAGGAARERTLRQRAEVEAQKATAVGEYLVGVFEVADPFTLERRDGSEPTARALLDQGARRVDSTLAGQPEVQAQLRTLLGRAYTNLGRFDQATALLRRSLAQHRALYREPNLTIAEDLDRLGDALIQQDQYDEAEPLLRQALAQRRALLGSSNEATAETLNRLATLYQRRNEYAPAESLFREALALRRAALGDTAAAVAQSLSDLGLLLFQRDAYDQAEAVYREALAIYIRQLGEDHPRTAATLQNLAQVQERQGQDAEAEALYRRALAAKRKTLGNAHPSVTVNLNNLAELLIRQNRADEAEPLVREALALDRQIFGERHSYVAASLRNLASVLKLKGDFAEAERYYLEALAINRALLGPEHSIIATSLNDLGTLARLQGDLPRAVPYLREAAGMARRQLGEDHLSTLAVSVNLGRALEDQGNLAEAEQLLRGALEKLDPATGAHRGWYVGAQSGLGLVLIARGRAAEARDRLEPVVELARRELGEEHPRTSDARLTLGRALLATREYDRAEPVLRAAAEALERQRKSQPVLAAQAAAALAELRKHRGG